ncbi:hypothetical protein BJF83_08015 [Nocardiopsis sp. CNR-923]|uniref:hypothetical protein n=1 Tax=Nocardiopsis sp. CNR-923 TaxID=1904965 RepID=UPI00095D3F68|nr:hypothetical protein [Nocardiopsis sp. CNR-923]OLT30637.1 hypothetical protein BJF83_08015 [Nocardiopsis sp. CNR-923]
MNGVLGRPRAALVWEARTHARHGTAVAAAGLALVWAAVVHVLPEAPGRTVAGLLLYLDTAGFGVLFVAVLMLGERTSGAWAALAVSPLGAGEYLTARLVAFTVIAAVAAVPITAAARPVGGLAGAVVAVAGTALLAVSLCAVSVAACAFARDVATLMAVVPLCLGPLLVPPLLVAAGVADHPLLYAVPSTAAHTLVRWGLDPGSVPVPGTAVPVLAAVAVLAAAGACLWARWALVRARAVEGSRPRWSRVRWGGRPSRGPRVAGRPVRVLTWVDLRRAGTDGMVWALLAGPVVVALGLRAGLAFVSDLPVAAGVDVAGWRPVLLSALVLLHVPMMAGSAVALRAVEDRERGALALWGASPLGTGAYLASRAAVAAGVAVAQLAVVLPLSGLVDGGARSVAGAIPAAGLLAAALALAVVATARDRVRALVVLKGVGVLFVLAPVAVWALPPPWPWFLLPLPVTWPLAALPAYGLAPVVPAVLSATAAGVLLVVGAWRWACAAVDG